MSNGDKTPEERLAAIETLQGVLVKQFDRAEQKIDQILSNGKSLVTLPILTEAIHSHVESCPSRTSPNPGPKTDSNEKDIIEKGVDVALKGWRGLGAMGAMFLLNMMLTLIVLKLVKVF
jgi:hypothetical protein